MLREIKAEAEGLDEMVRNLLAMTRIDAGALELRKDWVDLREIVERVINAAKRRGAALAAELDLPATLPLIRADASLIEQAVGNVVNNVVSHAPEGARLVVDAIVTQQSVSIRATDDGPGIPRGDHAPRVRKIRAGAGRRRQIRRDRPWTRDRQGDRRGAWRFNRGGKSGRRRAGALAWY